MTADIIKRHTKISSGLMLVFAILVFVPPVIAQDTTLICDYCGEPITDNYIIFDSGTYHESCYEDHVALRCAVCGQVIEGEYLIDHWGNVAHAHHKGEVPQCEYCNRFISDYTTGGGYRYEDGRFICTFCERSAVTSTEYARTLMHEIAGSLGGHGILVDVDDIPLLLVGRDEIGRLRGTDSEKPEGLTRTEKSTIMGGAVIEETFEIYLLTGMPRMHFISTLAHELMHVWLHKNAPEDIDSILCEGSCNYAAYLILENYSGIEADFIRVSMRNNPDYTYGEGFRRVARFVTDHGVEFWLEYLRNNSTPPW